MPKPNSSSLFKTVKLLSGSSVFLCLSWLWSVGAGSVAGLALAAAPPGPEAAPISSNAWTVDFRYAPPDWQTSICLPDDWQKTLVGKDGSLLYDYPGSFSDFSTRIGFGFTARSKWVRQELVSPRVPIVRTVERSGVLEVEKIAFALAPPLPVTKSHRDVTLERIDSDRGQADWAAPPDGTDPAFRHVAIGWNRPIEYRFGAEQGKVYTVVFGLCEGWHEKSGQRILTLKVEGQSLRTVDLVAEKGRNVPQLFSFPARDENSDGWIDLEVTAAEGSPDRNTILNVLWIFGGTKIPAAQRLLLGQDSALSLVHHDCGMDPVQNRAPRHDVVIVRLRNTGTKQVSVNPTLTIDSSLAIDPEGNRHRIRIGPQTTLFSSLTFEHVESSPNRLRVECMHAAVAPSGQKAYAFVVGRGLRVPDMVVEITQAESWLREAEAFWQKADLPFGRIQVPDGGIQAVLDSSIRNIYQAREIKKGLPAFQVGPTCYRGLWVVDGSFLLEAVTFLGRWKEARQGILYLMSFQRQDGAFMLIDGHWKETGIALWAITRHARLTGDKAWLESVWPKVEKGFSFIRHMRGMPPDDAPNARLIPDGFSDGGLSGKLPEYTNVYWTLAGLRAAVEAARWLGRMDQAEAWQSEYDDFYTTFRRAAERDMRPGAEGTRHLPIRMVDRDNVPPQKAQWAFLHAVFPGKVFAADDPLVLGNMALLKAEEREGLVFDTGWLKEGLWNYFGSFYGHAWLWLGQGGKAAECLYAFANHASPLLVWREEHMPAGQGAQKVGDMPHNWASAEFIRLVRHSLVLERGDELHLFEGMPPAWARPGSLTALRDVATLFGPLSLEFQVADDGARGRLHLIPPNRTPPKRIILHLDSWSGRMGTVELPLAGEVEREVPIDLAE